MTNTALEQRVLPISVTVILSLGLDGKVDINLDQSARTTFMKGNQVLKEFPDRRIILSYSGDLKNDTEFTEEDAALFFSGAKRITLDNREYIMDGEVARLEHCPMKEITYKRM